MNTLETMTMTMTLPNGATRTGREILDALERCKGLDPAQMVKGWNIHPQTAAEEQLRAPMLAGGVALQGVLWPEDETLFTGRAVARK